MKKLYRLLLAGIVFVTPSAAIAAGVTKCAVRGIPATAECFFLGQHWTWA